MRTSSTIEKKAKQTITIEMNKWIWNENTCQPRKEKERKIFELNLIKINYNFFFFFLSKIDFKLKRKKWTRCWENKKFNFVWLNDSKLIIMSVCHAFELKQKKN